MENVLTFNNPRITKIFNRQFYSLYDTFKRDLNKQLMKNPNVDDVIHDQLSYLENLLNGNETLKNKKLFESRLNFTVNVNKIREGLKLIQTGRYKIIDENNNKWLPLVHATVLIYYYKFLPNDAPAFHEYIDGVKSRELILFNIVPEQRELAIKYLYGQLIKNNFIATEFSEFEDHFQVNEQKCELHRIVWKGEQKDLIRLWYEIHRRGMIANKSISVMIKQHFLRVDEKKGIIEMQVHRLTDHLGDVNGVGVSPTIERIINDFIRQYRIR
jgi:hypothetical protein